MSVDKSKSNAFIPTGIVYIDCERLFFHGHFDLLRGVVERFIYISHFDQLKRYFIKHHVLSKSTFYKCKCASFSLQKYSESHLRGMKKCGCCKCPSVTLFTSCCHLNSSTFLISIRKHLEAPMKNILDNLK